MTVPAVPDRIGPYRIVRALGSGAMGTVYLAEEEGSRVALKVLHPHLLQKEGFFRRFQREARAGRRVDHENVVRTLHCDLHLAGEIPYCFLVMEYVEGRTLREVLRETRSVPEALLREVARQTAAGLGAIHAAGIVHRDLKPENVLITDDRRVRIMDLGVARLEAATAALTRAGQFAGSLFYASPEQIRGREAGPASDLYSLGVMLLELSTGENPFRHEDPGAVVHAHLEREPPRAGELNREISPFLSELVAVLLAKDPAARIASATALEALLEEGEGASWWGEREQALRRRERRRPRVQVRRETELVGRGSELEELRQAWSLAGGGEGRVVLLEGEAGIGKSRLVDAFLEGLGDEDAHVLYGSYSPAGGLGGLSDGVLGRFGTARLAETLRPYLEVTPGLVPSFAALLKHEGPPEGGAPLEAEALRVVFGHLLRALAAEKPVIWVVEDLHFADRESRAVVLAMARALPGRPVLLLLTTRPGLPEEEASQLGLLPDFRRAVLSRLSPRKVVLLLRDAFRSEALADKLGAKIAYKSDGVPFFVFEMIRGLKEGQFISQLPDGSFVETRVIEDIDVPSAVRGLIDARLSDLDDGARRILDVAAVVGFEFEPDLVARVLGRSRFEALQQLAEIERRSGVVRSEGRLYRFDHHQIQEVVYSDLPVGLREECHALVAEALASRPGAGAWLLLHHHLSGSRPEAGLPFLETGLEQLRESNRNEAVVELTGLALEANDLLEGRTRVEALLRRARSLGVLGRQEEKREVLDEARSLADATDDLDLRTRVRCAVAGQRYMTGTFDSARDAYREALDLAMAADDPRTEGEASGGLGSALFRLGRREEARPHLERALELARETGDRESEGQVTTMLGKLFTQTGRYAEAQEHFEQHLRIARETGDLRAEAFATENVGYVQRWTGRLREARESWERSRALYREAGYRLGEGAVTGNIGSLCLDLGRYDEARELSERWVTISRQTGYPRGESIATGNLAMAWQGMGRYATARKLFLEQLAADRDIGYLLGEAEALTCLGRLDLVLGMPARARESVDSSRRLVEERGFRGIEGGVLFALAEIASHRGEEKEAERLLTEALAVARDTSLLQDEAATLGRLGALLAATGRFEEAAPRLVEARTRGRELDAPGVVVLAGAWLALFPGADAAESTATFKELRSRLSAAEGLEARFVLWRATREPTYLGAAHALLDELVEHAPEEHRESMVENVSLHRDIATAWETGDVPAPS